MRRSDRAAFTATSPWPQTCRPETGCRGACAAAAPAFRWRPGRAASASTDRSTRCARSGQVDASARFLGAVGCDRRHQLVLERFRDARLDDGLCRDRDRVTGRRVAPGARRAFAPYELHHAGKLELSRAFELALGHHRELVEEFTRRGALHLEALREVRVELVLTETFRSLRHVGCSCR